DKMKILQDSDQWSAIPGYPGPATPATDEIYYAFIINDMMAKAATGQSSAEDSVKWATQQCEAIMKKWAGRPDRRSRSAPARGPGLRLCGGYRVKGVVAKDSPPWGRRVGSTR